MPQLGVAPAIRHELSHGLSYPRFFEMYRDTISDEGESLNKGVTLASEGSTAFMCREVVREQCHRSELSKLISERVGLPIIELTKCPMVLPQQRF
jgi:hypothetical protein